MSEDLDLAARPGTSALWLISLGATALALVVVAAVITRYVLPPPLTEFVLMFAALLGAGVGAAALYAYYVAWRDSPVQQLEYLNESVDRLANGDSSTPIWGLYRNDIIGDLARNLEHLREYFTEPADAAVKGQHGLVRVKFDGAAAPLFEQLQNDMQAAMHKVAEAAERLQETTHANRAETHAFTSELRQNLLQLTEVAATCTGQIDHIHDDLRQSSQRLTDAQTISTEHLGLLVPAFEQRLDTLDEIVRLAGRQTEATLRHLQHSSQQIQETAQFGNTVSQKFARDAEELSGRMVAAINVLRSSGKALAETNDLTRNRVGDIVNALVRTEEELRTTLDHAASRMTLSAEMAERIANLTTRAESSANLMTSTVDSLLQHNQAVAKKMEDNGKRFDAMLHNVEGLQQNFAKAIGTVATRSNQMEQTLNHLRGQHERLMAELVRSGGDAAGNIGRLATESEQLIARIEAQLALAGAIADGELRRLGDATTAAAESAQIASTQLTQATQLLLEGGSKIDQVSGNMQTQLARIDREVCAAVENMVTRTDEISNRTETKIAAVYDRVDDMAQRLTALTQLTGTMGQVAAQLGGIIPQLSHGSHGSMTGAVGELRQELRTLANGIGLWQQEVAATLTALPERLRSRFGAEAETHWTTLAAQIDSARQEVLSGLATQADAAARRFGNIEEISGFVAEQMMGSKPAEQTQAALRGVLAALGQITTQLQDLDQKLPKVPMAGIRPEHGVDQALAAVTDIFASLRDRGDDVINRLNLVAGNLQNVASKITQKGD